MSSEPDGAGPAERYRERKGRFGTEAERLGVRSGRVANLRLLVFVAALAAVGWGLWTAAPVLVGLGVGLLGGFVGLVVYHRRIERARRRLVGLARINAEAGRRVARDWDRLPLRHAERAAAEHPYAADLDLFGRASLLHLLEAVGTRLGEATLARWLLGPAGPDVIRERQAAVAELALLVEWRDELIWRGGGDGGEQPDPEPFLAWAEEGPWLPWRRGLLWAARVSPPLLWIGLAAHLGGLVDVPVWLVPLFVNLGLGVALVGQANRTIARVRWFGGQFRAYADALELLLTAGFEAAVLRRLQAILAAHGVAATERLRRLDRIVMLAQPPSSMVYPLVELATLWNVHILDALERWQAEVGPRARGWLAALGEAEALAALARLAHDNPGWAFPGVDPMADRLTARGLGHPLLPDDVRIVNDVEVGPAGTFLLVTGSNMSGKSTLLRAIGVNVVLAQAGGPACASELRLPPSALWTSMRVQDSLERGVSYFMAELQRLKQIVDASEGRGSRTSALRGGERRGPSIEVASSPHPNPLPEGEGTDSPAAPRSSILYLLDEILQGTNTAERQIAARRIIRLLLARGAFGAVSTHDLTLADAEDLAAAARAVHLTETVTDGSDGPAMSFDYRLRPGIARSTNALLLLELAGLPPE